MADNLRIVPGSGTEPLFATDDVAGVHYARAKLDGGPDSVAAPILGDSTYGLDVDVTRLPQPGASQVSAVSASVSSVVIVPPNLLRYGLTVWNDSTSVLYLKCGAGASVTSATIVVPAQGFYVVPYPVYTGALYGAWVSASGFARITETSYADIIVPVDPYGVGAYGAGAYGSGPYGGTYTAPAAPTGGYGDSGYGDSGYGD